MIEELAKHTRRLCFLVTDRTSAFAEVRSALTLATTRTPDSSGRRMKQVSKSHILEPQTERLVYSKTAMAVML